MSLINCLECGTQISDKAVKCPKCDNLINKMSTISTLIYCPECRTQISDKAEICISCGYPINCEDEITNVKVHGVILVSGGKSKLAVVKLVKDIAGVSLKEAKDLVDHAPKTIKEKISKEEAEILKEQFEYAGAKVIIKTFELNEEARQERPKIYSTNSFKKNIAQLTMEEESPKIYPDNSSKENFMSLIPCPECGSQVSDKAEKCPKCAYPIFRFYQRNIGRYYQGNYENPNTNKSELKEIRTETIIKKENGGCFKIFGIIVFVFLVIIVLLILSILF
jgi:ribosomal protein L7/L12